MYVGLILLSTTIMLLRWLKEDTLVAHLDLVGDINGCYIIVNDPVFCVSVRQVNSIFAMMEKFKVSLTFA